MKPYSFLWVVCIWCACQSPKSESPTGGQEVSALPYFNQPDFTPEWFDSNMLSAQALHRIAPFSFVNQNADTVTNQTFADKIYIANFFFASCTGICPKMADHMGLIQEAFKDDQEVLLISHSVAPWEDSIPRLRNYADWKDAIDNKWHLVTGNTEEIYTLARQSYFAEEEPGLNKATNEFLHTEHLLLVDGQGHIRGVYNGTLELEALRLIEDIKLLKQEG